MLSKSASYTKVQSAFDHLRNQGHIFGQAILLELARFGLARESAKTNDLKKITKLINDSGLNKEWGFDQYSILDQSAIEKLLVLDGRASIIEAIVTLLESDLKMGTYNFPSKLFDELISKSIENEKGNIALLCVENCISTAINIAARGNFHHLTLTVHSKPLYPLIKYIFHCYENVDIPNGHDFHNSAVVKEADVTIAFPPLGARLDSSTMEPELIESFRHRKNVLSTDACVMNFTLSGKLGSLFIGFVPEGFLFNSGTSREVRENIKKQNIHVQQIIALPSSTLFPYTRVKSNFIVLEKRKIHESDSTLLRLVDLETQSLKNPDYGKLKVREKELSSKTFLENEIWTVSLQISEKIDINGPSKKLGTLVTEMFRGAPLAKANSNDESECARVVENKDLIPRIDATLLEKSYFESSRQTTRYQLQDGDVLLTSRGSQIKAGVIESVSDTVLPSQNLVVLRVDSDQLDPNYLVRYLTSKAGEKELQGRQAGTTMLVLRTKELGTIDIPLPSLNRQREIVAKIDEAESTYLNTTADAKKTYDQKLDEALKDMGVVT